MGGEVRYMTEKEKNEEIQIQYDAVLIDLENIKKECKALDNDKYELEIKLDDAEFFLKDAESKMKECTKNFTTFESKYNKALDDVEESKKKCEGYQKTIKKMDS